MNKDIRNRLIKVADLLKTAIATSQEIADELNYMLEDAHFPANSVAIAKDNGNNTVLIELENKYYIVDSYWIMGNLKRLPDHPSKRQVYQALHLSNPDIKGISEKYKERTADLLKTAEGSTKHIASGSDILYKIIPKEYAMDLYDLLAKEDKQAAELFLDVTYELQKQLTLSEGAENALSRIIGIVANGKRWEPSLLRNNIFKAANSLGMKLSSSNF